MPINYDKWDNLELSDDSDIEVHPNVDKRSFIRAKQNQIHQERSQRKHQIETLKYERIINNGFLQRIDGLLTALQSHKAEAEARSPDELIFQSLMESSNPDMDQPPQRPEGIHSEAGELPTYSKMIATLIDQVKDEVAKSKPDNQFDAYVSQVKVHEAKILDLQRQLNGKLSELEREETRKITSESIHDGFNTSSVAKADTKTQTSSSNSKSKVQAVEVLNPHALKSAPNQDGGAQSSGADGDDDEPPSAISPDSDDEEVEPTELGKQFAQIKLGDYRSCLEFISRNPTVVAERETDGLLIMAFNAQLSNKDKFARQCVHQALLLQYCRSLGRDGVGLFFKRITTKGHEAQKVFGNDVNDTYSRIRTRAKEINLEREKEDPDNIGGVEQIQLHAVDPGTAIMISIPPKTSEDPTEIAARQLFEAFPPGLQRALESGELDEVNKVLGKMSVEEAEEVVGQLGEGGMLSLEEQIIDATTEEGQAALKEFEEQERAAAKARYSDDPE